jgi:hypothetical protein
MNPISSLGNAIYAALRDSEMFQGFNTPRKRGSSKGHSRDTSSPGNQKRAIAKRRRLRDIATLSRRRNRNAA